MSVALEKLRPDMFFYADTLSAELSFRERLTEQLTAVFNWHSGGELHGVLIGSELDHLAELVRSTEVALQVNAPPTPSTPVFPESRLTPPLPPPAAGRRRRAPRSV